MSPNRAAVPNATLKRLLADSEVEKAALKEIAKGNGVLLGFVWVVDRGIDRVFVAVMGVFASRSVFV